MESVENLPTLKTVIHSGAIMLCAVTAVICYRRIIPFLSPISIRLAGIMLLGQVSVMTISVILQPNSGFERWLWELNGEWNIPASLASAQLSLVSAVALVTAWLAKARPSWERLYIFAIGMVFLFLAYDEYTAFHEFIADWEQKYAAFGAGVALATLLVALRSPRRVRMWCFLLLIGLAISAVGGLAVEQLKQPQVCASLGVLSQNRCDWRQPIEESLEFFGIWLTLVAMLGQFSDVSPAPTRPIRLSLMAFPALWIVVLILTTEIVSISDQTGARPAAVAFESDVRLQALSIKEGNETLTINLFLSSSILPFNELGYSIHLVDQVSGHSIVSLDQYASVGLDFVMGPGFIPAYRQWTLLEITPETAINRAHWIALTLWREDGDEYLSLPVIASDHRLLSDTQVILDEFALQAEPRQRAISPIALFEHGLALEHIDIPAYVIAGQTINVTFSWHSSVEGTTDLAQFLHFVHDDSGAQWGYDQQPLGPRLPTRLWYSGLSASETWQIPLWADLSSGEYQVFTGLYRLSDAERVPASDAQGRPFVAARVPLGRLVVE